MHPIVFAEFVLASFIVWILPGGILCSKLHLAKRFSPDHFVSAFILSCALSPVSIFITANLWGWSAVKLVACQLMLSVLLLLLPSVKRKSACLFNISESVKSYKGIAVLVLAVLVLAVLLPYIEISTDSDIYQCIVGDWDGREAVIWSIDNFGLPLQNPFYYPGKPVRMYYPLFFYLMPAAVSTITSGIPIVASWLFGTVMIAVALCWILAEYTGSLVRKPAVWIWTVCVAMFVGGFDWLVVSAKFITGCLRGNSPQIVRHVDAWANASQMRVINIYASVIWIAPHVCALLMFLFLILLMPVSIKRTARAILSGIVLAAIFGLSPYVFIVAAVVLLLYWLRIFYRAVFKGKSWALLWGFWVMLFVCAVILVPYVWDLQKADLSAAKSKLAMQVPESDIAVFTRLFSDAPVWRLLDMPIYFFAELGPLLLLAVIGYKWVLKKRALTHRSWYLVWAVCGSFVIASLFGSTGKYNDLGMKAALIVQAGLVVFATIALVQWKDWQRKYRIAIATLIFAGFVSVAWEIGAVGLSRFILHYPADRFELYKACRYISEHTPENAVIAVSPGLRRSDRARRWMERRTMIAGYWSLAYAEPMLLHKTRMLNDSLFSDSFDETTLGQLRENNVSYVLVKIQPEDFHSDLLDMVYRNSDYVVMAVR